MNALSVLCIFIGVLAAVLRGIMIFMPKKVGDTFQEIMLKTNTRIRLMGVFFAGLGALLAYLTYGEEQLAHTVMFWLAAFWVVLATFILIVVPGIYRRMAAFFFEMDTSVHRGIGVAGVIFGLVFIYLGVAVF